MKQYNRIMPGEHGKYIKECVQGGYIGTDFLPMVDLSQYDYSKEREWKDTMIAKWLQEHPDKTARSAATSIGFLWTVSFGLPKNTIVLSPNGDGAFRVGLITGDYFYCPGGNLAHRRPVTWFNKLIERKSLSKNLQNSIGSIGTCCNITKYADEIENLIGKETTIQVVPSVIPALAKETFKERDLHRLLSNFLKSQKSILSKTIFHEASKKSDQNQKWIHPDMVGVNFNDFREDATVSLMKAADIKQYVDLFSFELKCSIRNDHELKEAYFQALSNSSWANFGYLVSFDINAILS